MTMHRSPKTPVSTLFRISCAVLVAMLWLGHAASWASAQEFQDFGIPQEQFGGQLQTLELSASFTAVKGTNQGEISIRAMIQPDWYIYSLTQPKGGPVRTSIQLSKPEQIKSVGTFKPNIEPTITTQPEAFKDLRIEKHTDMVIFTAPIEFKDGTDVKKLKIDFKYKGQVCKKSCKLVNENLVARFAKFTKPKIKPVGFKPSLSHVLLTGRVSPSEPAKKIKAGQKFLLKITAKGLDEYHVYAYSDEISKVKAVNPTLIAFTSLNGWKVSQPKASNEPVSKKLGPNMVHYHDKEVTWTFEIEVPSGTEPETYNLAGVIGFQTCTDLTCDRPDGVLFNIDVAVDRDSEGGDVNFRDATYGEAKQAVNGPDPTTRGNPQGTHAGSDGESLPWEPFSQELLSKYAFVTNESGKQVAFDLEKHQRSNKPDVATGFSLINLLQAIMFGFLGGLILNIMPCVLPVIGLKIMSFVQQGGEKKGKAFALNVSYSAGIIFVFLVLATLGVFAGVTWGKQFQSQTFNIVLSCVVFVFALSLIGVWEIPIPGFVGSEKANNLAEKEGMSGAFFKGILTTLLATPCTGPFIVPVLSWAFGQHPIVIYAVFIAMGIGMASPFLIIGANPKMVSFLPKPGAWMSTFKHAMGFVLLGTVIWILRNVGFIELLPAFTLLFGLWLGCWWIGSMQFGAPLKQKSIRWIVAIAMVSVCGYLAFGIIGPESKERFDSAYQSRAKTAADRPPGNYTFLVDFTAVW